MAKVSIVLAELAVGFDGSFAVSPDGRKPFAAGRSCVIHISLVEHPVRSR
jgi:hypothetical protein